eukprot:322304-Prymnesium_polylepis.1
MSRRASGSRCRCANAAKLDCSSAAAPSSGAGGASGAAAACTERPASQLCAVAAEAAASASSMPCWSARHDWRNFISCRFWISGIELDWK